MKKITIILLTLWMGAKAMAGGATWLTNLPEAADQARKDNELLLLDFTGSDWCGWCMKLDEEIFSKREFIDYAGKNLVLVQVDFPMHKAQANDLKAANRALAKKYQVTGYPTVLIIKPDGKVLWEQRGFEEGSPGTMIDAVNRCRRASGLATPFKPEVVAAAAPAKPAAPVPAAPIPPPAPPPQKPSDEPKLQGIFYSASHSSVVLDGVTCDTGHTVKGMRVLKIESDKVIVEYQGQIKLLKMMENQDQIMVTKMK
jgi:protein disulfide-isomerase